MASVKGDVKDFGLAALGKKRIDWAEQNMPVLRQVRDQFARRFPSGVSVSREIWEELDTWE